MRAKWYVSTLIIVFSLLGIFREQISVPNQEIVLEFEYNKITTDDVEDVIAAVKKELHTLGADNINVGKQEDGKLRITYYSDVNVVNVKKILSEAEVPGLVGIPFNQDQENEEFPFTGDHTIGYNLNVYEIQKDIDGSGDLNGTLVTELKHEYDRSTHPNLYFFKIEDDDQDHILEVIYRVQRTIAIAIDTISHNVPDVRAGPIV